MMTNRLLRHDLLLIRNGLADVLGSWRDRLLLCTVAAIGLGWLINSHPLNVQIAPPWLPSAMLVVLALAAVGTMQAVGGRLREFVEQSALCADALNPSTRLIYRVAALTPVVIVSILVTVIVPRDYLEPSLRPLTLAAALFAGAVIPSAATATMRLLRSTWGRATEAQRHRAARSRAWSPRFAVVIAARQTMTTANTPMTIVVPGLLALVVAALSAAVAGAAGDTAGAVVLGVFTLGVLLVLTRIDAELVRFAAFTGVGPLKSASDHFVAAGIFYLVLTPAEVALVQAPGRASLIILVITLAVASLTAARIWHYRTRPRRAADLAIQADLAATGLLGSAFPPLAAGWLLLRIAYLYRAARVATWAMP